jgi:hypothetical protein
MAAVLVIVVKGTSPKEIEKNIQIIEGYMNPKQSILKLISDVKNNLNLRIYYSGDNVITKDMHTIISDLRTGKDSNAAIKSMYYHASLNKV